ncbi:MAG: hypothetical protein O7G88_05885 [bacterium]|nr:hypothetical protein [bacterium]
MPSQIFISGLILGFLLGVLVCYVGLQIISRRRYLGHKRDIDRLTDDFQQLFRQIDEENKGS